MYHRYEIICEDGSRETVIAKKMERSYEPGIGTVVRLKPSHYSDVKQGEFYNPQGIHRTEKNVEMPDVGFEDEDE